MTFMERVEQEFGEPFVDFIQGFADMGYGCDTTAKILDYHTSTFRRLLARHGIEIRWPGADRRIDNYQRNPWPGYQRMIEARRAMCPLYTDPATGRRMTATQWADCLGISCTQFLRRVKQYGNQRRVFVPNMRRCA